MPTFIKTGFWRKDKRSLSGELNLEKLITDVAGNGGGSIPVLTEYPTTTSALAGQRFIYKGNEWQYMTQEEIDSTGWTELVSVGFPAPMDKYYNKCIAGSGVVSDIPGIDNITGNFVGIPSNTIDFIGLGILVSRMKTINLAGTILKTFSGGVNVTNIRNGVLLKSLENAGTANALDLTSYGLSTEVINSLFTQLPSTTKTATINVASNPGSTFCNPTIATSKGYTVLT